MSSTTPISGAVRRLILWVGSTQPSHLPKTWVSPAKSAVDKAQEENPKIARAEIKGSHPHKSHNDRTDPEDVVSIVLSDEVGKRIVTIHVHEDGTFSTPQKK